MSEVRDSYNHTDSAQLGKIRLTDNQWNHICLM